MPIGPTRILSAITLSFASLLLIPSAKPQTPDALSTRIDQITSRPVFRHANFGIEIYSLDQNKTLFSQNPDKLFVPASTTKLLTEGTLLARLGADYRFHTRIYRNGTIDKKGHLKGDLILVASGDPNLSNRLQPDGTLAFRDEDHSYQGPAVSGDPLTAIKEIAKQVAAKGIRKITGHIYIDSSLFPEGDREGGTGVVMSAIIVNDNVIDLLGKPGKKVGDPIEVQTSPRTSYITFVNQLLTLPATSKPTLETPSVITNPDGNVKVILSGGIPVGAEPQTGAFSVPAPTQFAQTVFREALQEAGITVEKKNFVAYDGGSNRFYTAENLIAEHVSAPLSEEIKITLKVSQNLHASMGTQYLGAFTTKIRATPCKMDSKRSRLF